MFATAITLAIMGFAIRALNDLVRHDGSKIMAALQGRSWTAERRQERPIAVRFSSTRKELLPAWSPGLRAAA
jgi:hypothetical protein